MTHPIDVNDQTHPPQEDIVQLAGHIYQGNGFRTRPLRTEGPAVVVGRIPNRNEIFHEAPAE